MQICQSCGGEWFVEVARYEETGAKQMMNRANMLMIQCSLCGQRYQRDPDTGRWVDRGRVPMSKALRSELEQSIQKEVNLALIGNSKAAQGVT